MQLSHERPDYGFVLRGADATSARVNDQVLTRSFAIAPDRLLVDWDAPATAAALAACLTRGIGIEAMDNAAAARTYNVLAGEGRRVVVAMLLG